ncbi:molybdopterin-dependent oxidoreductase [Salmonella enterica subsp. enterica]|nr:molybdopterin-dependent oxidoreductase [Salmonella enterica subsp. enterica]
MGLIIEDADKAKASNRRARSWRLCSPSWQEVNTIAAQTCTQSENLYPDRVAGFFTHPGDVDGLHASGARYLSLIGGTCLSFYDPVLRPAASLPANLGRADRRAGIR